MTVRPICHDESVTGIVIFAHGSPIEEANEGVRAMTEEIARRGNFAIVDTAFLDCAAPDLAGSVRCMAERGVTRIIVVPFFLTLGIHLRRDLPGIVKGLEGIHPGVGIEVTSPLEGHPALIDAMTERARKALDRIQGGEAVAGKAD